MSVEGKAEMGKLAPTFTVKAVVDEEFVDVSLRWTLTLFSDHIYWFSDYAEKWVVLFFYPLDFTFVCPTEIIAFSEAAKKFRAANCEVLGMVEWKKKLIYL